MSASGWVHIDVEEIKQETPAAFLVIVDDVEIWLPKSQISDPSDYKKGDTNCSMSISEWIAKEKGLED